MYPIPRPRLLSTPQRSAAAAILLVVVLAFFAPAANSGQHAWDWIDHVVDGDTVKLSSGRTVRLVQIDTPEVYPGTECYGQRASAITKRLLRPGMRVSLVPEPYTDYIDDYGRLLRYVFRARDDLNVNLRLVALGAAAPYFYEGRRGRYANRLEALAKHARARHLGLWGACPHTPYNPYRGVEARR